MLEKRRRLMASPEKKYQELKSERSAVLDLVRQDPELMRIFNEMENDGSWESLLEAFENGKYYSDKREFKVTELLENLLEQNPPEAEKLLGMLANVVGQKYGDLRGRLEAIQNRLEQTGTLSTLLARKGLAPEGMSYDGPSPPVNRDHRQKPKDRIAKANKSLMGAIDGEAL
jgi:hypothetical protein